ncbi:YafY family protein [Butyrivibrio sp. INlla16]|uniref:helix-turn-helix transcriptional regulator n=1 Tax=Butyrivibrio sp. INlla16 TaxID=1520807 RepID=UPI000885463B|nr:WYL domain-containing protein [Butyrivibrio sp. INlla16]SDB54271.1 WYL domain-containing protein [Butyrivibrio sp. INlla16]
MAEDKEVKSNRALSIYSRLMNGRIIYKTEEAVRFGVSEKSIQRDIEQIRSFLDNQAVTDGIPNNLIYDYQKKGYLIEQAEDAHFSNDEILATCKILLSSRAFTKKEMNIILDKLIACCVPISNQKIISDLMLNERYHYVELTHKQNVLDKMMLLGNAIEFQFVIEFQYQGVIGVAPKHREVEPLAIMFSEFYFYLAGRIRNIDAEKEFDNPNDAYPTIYRIDRIKKLVITEEHFSRPYRSRFEEGEYRKRIQFMYGGKLRKIKFRYSGYSVDAVLDRLPTAKILGEDDGKYLIEAEVFGDGIDMWIRSQGNFIELMDQ